VNITNTYSAYLSDVINITDKFSILAAVRADRFESKGGKTGGADDAVYNQNALSPKFGIVYQPIKDVISIFANYQNSFTNPGAYTKYDPSSASKTATVIAELEQANQIEGGVKLDAFKGKLSATISYYDIKVKDMLRSDVSLPAAGLFASVQDGAQLSKGIEAELIANPFKGLNIVGGFSYNDSKMETQDPDVNGRRPAYASSPILANLFFSYRLPDNAIKGLGFGFGGNYASDNKVINSVSSGIFILPAYTLLNASLFYENSKIRLGAKIDNLTNEKYWIGYGTANPQKLRSFAGSIAYKF
jgi:iron complex outermembrane receptor protein